MNDLDLVRKRLEKWKSDLLDGSKSNPLLYFNSNGSSQRRNGVRLFANLEEIYNPLIATKPQPIPLSPAMLLGGVQSSVEDMLETDHQTYKETMRRLKRVRERAREAQLNRGIAILYVAFGLLEWREAATSESIQSPLVLVPVELSSKGSWSDDYRLTRLADSEIRVNPTLSTKLNNDFGITFPKLTEAGYLAAPTDTDTKSGMGSKSIQDILARLQQSWLQHTDAADWKIIPEAHLGLFTFQKEALYADLQQHAQMAMAHPIIRAICGIGSPPVSDGPIIPAERLDDQVKPSEMWQVLDADASQQEAIMAAKHGQSFVLQGPPGTGKSQTIANIIAECMAAGKRILFVSEKMAAIDVVQKRLADAGLGPFCLNLHSRSNDVAEKNRVYDALKTAITPTTKGKELAVPNWDEKSAQLERTRTALNRYVHDLHEKRSALGWSAFTVYGRLAHYDDVADLNCSVPDATSMTHIRYDECREHVQKLSTLVDVLAQRATHPWRFTPLRQCNPTIQANIRATYDQIEGRLDELIVGGQSLVAYLQPDAHEATEADLEHWLDLAAFALTSPRPLSAWLHADQQVALRELAQDAATHAGQLTKQEQLLFPAYRATVLDLDLATLATTLTTQLPSIRTVVRISVDSLLRQEAGWHSLLRESLATLADLQAAGAETARILGVPAAASLAEYGTMAEVATHLAATPRPLAIWLDPVTLAKTRKLVRATRKQYQQCAQNHVTLGKIYDDKLFSLDLAGLNERFTQEHASVIRLVKPAWYRDRKLIKAHVLPDHPFPNLRQLTADIALALQTNSLEQELQTQAEDHREEMGDHFAGAATDWDALQHDLDWTQHLLTLVEEWHGLTPKMVKLIRGSAYQLADLRTAYQRIADVWQRWLPLSAQLAEWLNIATLVQHPGASIHTVAATLLQDHLAQGQVALDQLWQISHTLNAQRTTDTIMSWEQASADLECARAMVTERAWFAAKKDTFSAAFAERFAAQATNWGKIQADLAWCSEAIQRHQGVTPPLPFIRLVTAKDDHDIVNVRDLLRTLNEKLVRVRELWRESDAYLSHEQFAEAQQPFNRTRFSTLRLRVREQREAVPILDRWIAALDIQAQCAILGLGEYVTKITHLIDARQLGPDQSEYFWPIFEKRFCQQWLTNFVDPVPSLKTFRSERHTQIITEFRQQDIESLSLSRQRLLKRMHNQRNSLVTVDDAKDPRAQSLQTVRYQTSLKRRKPLRKLIEMAGATLSDLMPCWMMSPLTVSEYVDPKVIKFDVVIFDEASQVCAEDAISAIMRGRQLIVVGDEKQLPPSNTFRKTLIIDEEDDGDDESQDIQRAESILKECSGAGLKNRMLLFHYRSQHEALIAFSNNHFYNGQLTTFPSSQAEHAEGLRFDYLADGIYGRGASRTNPREAAHVAELVIRHAQQTPEQSLGVVAFSAVQQDAIREAIERGLADYPELAGLLEEDTPDGFFVRNLESVQGDERDVIILSVGYGRDKAGKLTQAFGPLNSDGGERRLNVAITRARKRMILVASIKASDITGKSAGARALSGYLDFAERGKAALATAVPVGALPVTFDSPFEEAVYQALLERGLQLDTQVGCSNYRIDLAVRDPLHAGRYILGIECDGATYHSAKTARDRDRLRQDVLEHLGWKIHRIWSRDWFHDPTTEVRKVLEAVGAVARVVAATPKD